MQKIIMPLGFDKSEEFKEFKKQHLIRIAVNILIFISLFYSLDLLLNSLFEFALDFDILSVITVLMFPFVWIDPFYNFFDFLLQKEESKKLEKLLKNLTYNEKLDYEKNNF